MRRVRPFVFLCLFFALSACATSNGPGDYTKGFELAPAGREGFYYAGFHRIGIGKADVIQAYWLYNCAMFALSQGYDGFEVASSSIDVSTPGPAAYPSPPVAGAIPYLAGAFAFTFVEGPALQDNIQLLKKPFTPNPPKIFDAVALRDTYGPFVTGKK